MPFTEVTRRKPPRPRLLCALGGPILAELTRIGLVQEVRAFGWRVFDLADPPRRGGRWKAKWQRGTAFVYGRKRKIGGKEIVWNVPGRVNRIDVVRWTGGGP